MMTQIESDSNFSETPSSQRWQLRVEWLVLAFILTFAWHGMTRVFLGEWVWPRLPKQMQDLGWVHWWFGFELAYGLMLACPRPKESGLCIGSIRQHWKKVLLVCGGPTLVALIVYPLLPTKPWGDMSIHFWLTSPFAQDLLFTGFLYGRLAPLFPQRIYSRLPFTWALFVVSLFFAAWHIPNFLSMPAGYVALQLFYTFIGAMIIGLSRVWTGSMLYGTLTHTAINLIAWLLS